MFEKRRRMRSLFWKGCAGSLGLALAMCSLAISGQVARPGTDPEIQPGLYWWAGRKDGRGAADGLGEQARFSDLFVMNTANRPGIATDALGNAYVTDLGNQTVRKIDPSGRVTTLAGKAGVPGVADGQGEQARFKHPAGIASSRDGTLFVADSANHTIRRITPQGRVTTWAGAAGQAGADDGAGADARFNEPQGIALDAAGNVYVADRSNHAIRRISASGRVTTLAGSAGERPGQKDGAGSQARFSRPQAIVVDREGTLYVTEDSDGGLRKVSAGGVVVTLPLTAAEASWGVPKGTKVSVSNISGMALDADGSLLAAESTSNRIVRVSSSGGVTAVAGNFSSLNVPGDRDGASASSRFYRPVGVAVDGHGGIFVLDAGNATVRKIDKQGRVSTVAGRARKLGANGVSIDGAASGVSFNFQSFGPSWSALARGPDGSVYVAEPYSHVIRKMNAAGDVTLVAGAPGQEGSADGPGPQARFSFPCALVADAQGSVYVVDGNNHTIRKIDLQGRVSTLAGQAGVSGYADGKGRRVRFNGPRGIGIDATGNLFVSDLLNHVVRKIDPFGEVTTWAGTPSVNGHRDGDADTLFDSPADLTVDSAGTVYVVDGFSADRIRRISRAGKVDTPSAGEWKFAAPGKQTMRFGALTLGSSGALYLINKAEHTVWKVGVDGEARRLAGDPDWPGWGPGPLPGRLDHAGGLTALEGDVLAVTSGNAVMKVVQAGSSR